jgi:hypothetical protein
VLACVLALILLHLLLPPSPLSFSLLQVSDGDTSDDDSDDDDSDFGALPSGSGVIPYSTKLPCRTTPPA